jgi:hypothetical protein
MAFFVDLRADPLRSLAFGSISSSYAAIGTPFGHPVRMMIVQNFTNVQLTYSFDGINDHFVLPTFGQVIFDVTTNEFQQSGFVISVNTNMMVKGTGATSGNVYVSVFYARGS